MVLCVIAAVCVCVFVKMHSGRKYIEQTVQVNKVSITDDHVTSFSKRTTHLLNILSCLSSFLQVPTILNALQRSVQAVLVGKIQIQDWFGNGIKRAALMSKWVLKEVAIDEDERCLLQTDGSFLYLLCKDGLYKVGSGYSGTVRVRHMTMSAFSFDL